MLAKLSLVGLKHRFKDYLVLLTGLIISAAIFYMFAVLATNKAFLKSNSMVSMTAAVFMFGMVLLILITAVYVGYANSFLLGMRQHDYGLFMMLGAKKSRIGQLVFLETIVLGTIATVTGIIVGIGFAKGLSGLLIGQLGVSLHHFNVVYFPAMLTTLLLYLCLFLIASLLNVVKLVKMPVLSLLKTDETSYVPRRQPVLQIIEAVTGIGLLAIGYTVMKKILFFQLLTFPIALVTITMGTYLLFSAVVTGTIQLLQKTRFASYKLHNFTLGQILFRIKSYTRILTIVSLLFALALGAISVGAGFQRQVPQMARSTSAFAIALNDANKREQQLVKRLHVKRQVQYTQKVSGNTVYYNEAEFQQSPLPVLKSHAPKNDGSVTTMPLAKFKQSSAADPDFRNLVPRAGVQKSVFLDTNTFERQVGTTQRVTVIQVNNLNQDLKVLGSLSEIQRRRFPVPEFATTGQYSTYTMFKALFSGLEFMGFFLGIAFLAMLASCLMFKILSGATKDIVRYKMLNRIGTRQQLMKHALRGEILTLFAIPGILGIVDVVFGLQMFTPLMYNPYATFGWSLVAFVLLYAMYYLITVFLYERIVIPEEQLNA